MKKEPQIEITQEFLEECDKAQEKIANEFRSKYCEQCPDCGRRSSSMIGNVCRACYFGEHDPDEKQRFESLCERHTRKMTNKAIYLRRRKNILRLTALSRERLNEYPKSENRDERLRLILRNEKRNNHLFLLDEIWNYLHPFPRDWVSGSWGKHFEVCAAIEAIKEERFDAFCDALHANRT